MLKFKQFISKILDKKTQPHKHILKHTHKVHKSGKHTIHHGVSKNTGGHVVIIHTKGE